jgi:hypothetical protein
MSWSIIGVRMIAKLMGECGVGPLGEHQGQTGSKILGIWEMNPIIFIFLVITTTLTYVRKYEMEPSVDFFS